MTQKEGHASRVVTHWDTLSRLQNRPGLGQTHSVTHFFPLLSCPSTPRARAPEYILFLPHLVLAGNLILLLWTEGLR